MVVCSLTSDCVLIDYSVSMLPAYSDCLLLDYSDCMIFVHNDCMLLDHNDCMLLDYSECMFTCIRFIGVQKGRTGWFAALHTVFAELFERPPNLTIKYF